MPQTPIGLRLDDGLLRRVDEARGPVPRARFIATALERALSEGAPAPSIAADPHVAPAAPTRTPGNTQASNNGERQARLNKAKGM